VTKTKQNVLAIAALGALFLGGSLMQSRVSRIEGQGATLVTVTNPVNQPVLTAGTDNAAQQPFVSNLNCKVAAGPPANGTWPSIQVPAGKRAVIEFVDAYFDGEIEISVYSTGGNGTPSAYFLAPTVLPKTGTNYPIFSYPNVIFQNLVRIYSDPGSIVVSFDLQPFTSAPPLVGITLSGYYVNILPGA
jgi:hypothetical protein